MKQFYKRYLVPVAAALLSITFIIIITIPIQRLRKFGIKDFNYYMGMLGGYIAYLIYGICIGVTLFVMWRMFRDYSKKKRFWCYLVIGFVFWLIPGALPIVAFFRSTIIMEIFTNVGSILPVTGATLMVISPINLINKKSI